MTRRILTLPFMHTVRYKAPKMRTPEAERVLAFMEVEIPVAEEAPPVGLVLHDHSYGVAEGKLWTTLGREGFDATPEAVEAAVQERGVWRRSAFGPSKFHPLIMEEWTSAPEGLTLMKGTRWRPRLTQVRTLGEVLDHPTVDELAGRVGRLRDLEDDRRTMEAVWRDAYARTLMVAGGRMAVAVDALPAWTVGHDGPEFHWNSRRHELHYVDVFAPWEGDVAAAWAAGRGSTAPAGNVPEFLDRKVMEGMVFDRAAAVLGQAKSGIDCSDLRSMLNTGWCRAGFEAAHGAEALSKLDAIATLASEPSFDAARTMDALVSLVAELPPEAEQTEKIVEKTARAFERWTMDPSLAPLRGRGAPAAEENDDVYAGLSM